jgi:hypothetical protein
MEEGSFGGPNKKQVYGLSNTMAENLRAARSVSTVGSSQSVSSTQSQEFMALQQHTAHLTKKYNRLSANYEQLRQMLMDLRSQMGGTCAPLFGHIVPGTTNLLLLLIQLRYCSSSIFFWKHLKIVINIWMNII